MTPPGPAPEFRRGGAKHKHRSTIAARSGRCLLPPAGSPQRATGQRRPGAGRPAEDRGLAQGGPDLDPRDPARGVRRGQVWLRPRPGRCAPARHLAHLGGRNPHRSDLAGEHAVRCRCRAAAQRIDDNVNDTATLWSRMIFSRGARTASRSPARARRQRRASRAARARPVRRSSSRARVEAPAIATSATSRGSPAASGRGTRRAARARPGGHRPPTRPQPRAYQRHPSIDAR